MPFPAKPLGLIHRHLALAADAPGTGPVQRDARGVVPNWTETGEDRFRTGTIEDEFGFESQLLLLHLDLHPREIESAIPKPRFAIRHRDKLLLDFQRKAGLPQR